MPGCNCAGASCGCRIQAGQGAVVTGTGTASNPFVISTAITAFTIEQGSDGPLDLSSYAGDVAVTVNLNANVTSITLPDAPGTRLEIFFALGTAGATISWPAGVRWVGAAPSAPTTVGQALWTTLRQAAGFWAGMTVGTV